MPTCMIPGLPKRSDPTTPVLQTHFTVLNDIYCPSTARIPLSPPFQIINGNQPLANIANKSQVSDCSVYAVINHTQATLPGRKQQPSAKNPEYAAVCVSWTVLNCHRHPEVKTWMEKCKQLGYVLVSWNKHRGLKKKPQCRSEKGGGWWSFRWLKLTQL